LNVARWLRLGACTVTSLLLALIAYWALVAPATPRLAAGAILGLPLAIGIPFLYSGNRRSYGWLTLALAPPLVLGLTEAVANPRMRGWAAAVVISVFAAFALLVAYLRATRSSSLP
jgi:uncharacterized membrane protein